MAGSKGAGFCDAWRGRGTLHDGRRNPEVVQLEPDWGWAISKGREN